MPGGVFGFLINQQINVRFGLLSGLNSDTARCPLCAITGREQVREIESLLDQLVGTGKQQWRNGKPERLRGLKIDR
jgi:hypothetical protein